MSAVALDLPAAWCGFPIAPDGARRAQRELVDHWFLDQQVSPVARTSAVDRLVRESRQAHRDGIAFAAVLFVDLDTADAHNLVVASLTVCFRLLPGTQDPAVAAQGTLEVLRSQARTGYPTRRLELVGLGRDTARPAVLLREQQLDARSGLSLATSQVLWLVPGSSQLGSVAVATPNRELAGQLTELALGVATTLRVTGQVSGT